MLSLAVEHPLVRARPEAGRVQVLDDMRVRANEPASAAVLSLALPLKPQRLACDVLVAGASTGGVAAALAAASGGRRVCLTEETKWIGGQFTSQGVSAFDGNRYIETTGATETFACLRRGIRDYYSRHDKLSPSGAAEKYLNPGGCWVSALCFEPRAGLFVVNRMLAPYESRGILRVFLRTKVVKVRRQGNRITSVLAYDFHHRRWIEFEARYVLDATDTGELLPLAGLDYVTGAESSRQSGEPCTGATAGLGDIQPITYTFVLSRDAGHNHTIHRPPDYQRNLLKQPYTMTLNYASGRSLTYHLFNRAPLTPGSFWTYRRLIDAANFSGPGAPREVSLINWPGNDACAPGLLSNSPLQQARALRSAKRAALGLLYWLQTAVARDGGRGAGYPGLELVPAALGSADGLSQFPYVRESRRIRALKTITEQEISSAAQAGPRAAPFRDSVGIGLYPIDIHGCAQHDLTLATKPFQLPLGALIPRGVDNLLAASKDIGTTHITNGAYRLHPIEWAIGEAAGTVADFALDRGVTPRQIDESAALTEQLQLSLLRRGAPVYWFDDLERSNPAWAAAQFLAVRGIFGPDGKDLHFNPSAPVTRRDAVGALSRVFGIGGPASPHTHESALPAGAANRTFQAEAMELVQMRMFRDTFSNPAAADRDLRWNDLALASRELRVHRVEPGRKLNRADFAIWLERACLHHKQLRRHFSER